MADSKEAEQVNEELPVDELKSISGGLMNCEVKDTPPPSPQGTGSGITLCDWKKKRIVDHIGGDESFVVLSS